MNYPVPISKKELLEILDDVRAGVESGDTLEGFLNFLIPYPPAGDPEDADFMLVARYRIGNLEGQGGMRMIGTLEPSATATPFPKPEVHSGYPLDKGEQAATDAVVGGDTEEDGGA